jgi:alkylated DNA repair dioxygenase AlkB
MPNSQQPPKPKKNVRPGPLNLYLEKKDPPPVNEDEQDSLYTPSPRGHHPTSATRKKKGLKGSNNNSSNSEEILDVTSTPDKIRASVEAKVETSLKLKCPCGEHDGESTYVTCAKCQQCWHNKCSNLTGITSAAVKKLEFWQCPRCYRCPLLSRMPATLYADIIVLREEIRQLQESKSSASSECCQSIKDEFPALKRQIAELVEVARKNEVHHKLAPNLEDAIKNVSSFAPATVNNIETNVTELSQHVSELLEMSKRRPCEVQQPPELSEELSNLRESVMRTEKTISELSAHVSDIRTNFSSQSNPHSPPSCPANRPDTGQAMRANTSSPHLKKLVCPCSPFEKYVPDAVPQELKDQLLNFVQEQESEFTSVGEESREVLYFGDHSYRYTGKDHPAKEMPPVLQTVLAEIRSKLPPELNDSVFNSCLINKYQSGANHIPLHRDNEPVIDPESMILTVSIGAERKMTFNNNDKSKTEDLKLEDGSMLITSRYAQDFWEHGVLPDEDTPGQRISLTFRNIAPYHINSTKVLGDSNTSHIKFGTGVGTLGAWVPGQRTKVGHIEALPSATEIGPYRNIVIHTGINSINNPRFRKSNTYLLHFLEDRCREIAEVYPKARVHISLLLPSKSKHLNYHIDEFNRGIFDLTRRMSNVSVIDNSIFGQVLSDEYGRWDMNLQRPLADDIVHLGRRGIRALAMNFKKSVLGKGYSQSRSRFNAGRGSYGGAVGVDQLRDGYQPSG